MVLTHYWGFFVVTLLFAVSISWSWYRKSRYAWFWPLLSYRFQKKRTIRKTKGLKHILIIWADHFEPIKNNKNSKQQQISFWRRQYSEVMKKHYDADGKHPQRTWFYSTEQSLALLSPLSKLSFYGLGEIEVQLPSSQTISPDVLHERLELVKREFVKSGVTVTAEQSPKQQFGYIRSAEETSMPTGEYEIAALLQSGCFADFNRIGSLNRQYLDVNRICYADTPKSQKGTARVGQRNREDFLLVQGPLVLSRKGVNSLKLELEDGELSWKKPPTEKRVDSWVWANIHLEGRPDWFFVKLHTNGAEPENQTADFMKKLDDMFSYLENTYNDGEQFKLHYVTAREAYNIIKAAEDGKENDPGLFRDYIVAPYANTRIKSSVLYSLQAYSRNLLKITNLQPSRRCVFQIKKGQLERIEGFLENFELSRDLKNRHLLLVFKGNGTINCTVRTSKPIRRVRNGVIVDQKKLKGYFLTQVQVKSVSRATTEVQFLW